MVLRKPFLANQKHQYRISKEKNMITVPTIKRIELIMSIQVCLITRMKSNYMKNSGKKNFSCKSKASRSCIPTWITWCSAHYKKNADYYEYSSLSHFVNEFWLRWKEKLFLQIGSINIVHPNEENMIVSPIIKRMEIITGIQVYLI